MPATLAARQGEPLIPNMRSSQFTAPGLRCTELWTDVGRILQKAPFEMDLAYFTAHTAIVVGLHKIEDQCTTK